MKRSKFEGLITCYVKIIFDFLYDCYVKDGSSIYSMRAWKRNNMRSSKHPCACYATDSTPQKSNQPSVNIVEVKKYFSDKHKLYGYNVKMYVLPNGLAMFAIYH